MARPLRIEIPGGFYHVMTRGDRQAPIYDDETDRRAFMDIFAEVVERYSWRCYAYCLMTNHYHLVVQTLEPNLSDGMRQLNGVYTQASNRRHKRTGHVFEGRYKAIVMEADEYLMELARYVVLNPVRAGVVTKPEDWKWSSYRATAGEEKAPQWLATGRLLTWFSNSWAQARTRYKQFVAEGADKNVLDEVRQQVYLGGEAFVKQVQDAVDIPDDPAIIGIQRKPPAPPLERIAETAGSRNEAIVEAYKTGFYSYTDIGKYFGLHPSSIGRIIGRVTGKSLCKT